MASPLPIVDTMPVIMEPQFTIGVDVGGTKCAAGLVALAEGRVVVGKRQPTGAERGGQAVLNDVVALIRSLLSGSPEGRQVQRVGIGLAELVGTDGSVHSEATIRWRGLHVAQHIGEATGLAAHIEADVRAAARAEAQFGAGRPYDCFLYITIGTGISACLVLDQRPYPGALGLAGTFASSPGLIPAANGALAGGPPLEQFAAGPALAARLSAVRPDFRGAAPEVLKLSAAGDTVARGIVVTAGEAVGAAVAHLVNVVDPQAVLLGGGLGLAGGLYRQSLAATLGEYVWSDLHRNMPLLSAELGNDAGMIGAALGAAAAKVDG